MLRLIDTHAHIYTKDFKGALTPVLEKAQKNGIAKIYMPNIDESTIAPMVEVARWHPNVCLPMIGIHPCYVTKGYIGQMDQIERWIHKQPFIAIGEIGIDLYHSSGSLREQKEAFTTQLSMAKQYQLPVSIHCRNGFETMLPILEKEQDGLLKGVIHCFSTTLKEAQQYMALGFHLGIGGLITMQSEPLVQAIKAIPMDHLVLETDSPYLAPTPYRGQRNEPAYVYYVAEAIAGIKQISLQEVAEQTTKNAEALFEREKGCLDD